MFLSKSKIFAYKLYLSWIWLVGIISVTLWFWASIIVVHDSVMKIKKINAVNDCLSPNFNTKKSILDPYDHFWDQIYIIEALLNRQYDSAKGVEFRAALNECLNANGFSVHNDSNTNDLYVNSNGRWGDEHSSNFSRLLSCLLLLVGGGTIITISFGIKKWIIWLSR